MFVENNESLIFVNLELRSFSKIEGPELVTFPNFFLAFKASPFTRRRHKTRDKQKLVLSCPEADDKERNKIYQEKWKRKYHQVI